MAFGRQTQKVYEFLLENKKGLTVAEIAFRLRAAASDIYRLAKPLIEIGLVEKTGGRPFKLVVKAGGGLNLFLLDQTLWFQDRFGLQEKDRGHLESMQLEFIQGRDELMSKSTVEIDKCTKSVDLLRSGHEIPAETMRALTQAIKRGVKVRMLIQDYELENKEQIENWVKNGILIRKTRLKHLRLMIYDSNVGYFMSYKHSDSEQDIGMKIVYPPFTAILSQYFEDLWQKSEKITSI